MYVELASLFVGRPIQSERAFLAKPDPLMRGIAGCACGMYMSTYV